jgi:hypothetical protein
LWRNKINIHFCNDETSIRQKKKKENIKKKKKIEKLKKGGEGEERYGQRVSLVPA